MQLQQLPTPTPVALGARATSMIQPLQASLGKVTFVMGGGLVKSNVEVTGRIGARNFIGPIPGSHLDAIMKYRGQFDLASRLTVDLTDRTGMTAADKELGAIDLPGLGQDVFFEVSNTLGAGTPTLTGLVGYVGRQFRDRDGDGKITRGEQSRQDQLITKILRQSVPVSGTQFDWMPDFKGAKIKRLYFFYAGTDWTASADGNLFEVDVRYGGRPVHEMVRCLDNRFHQQEMGRVPQSRMYVVDFVPDGNVRKALDTARREALAVRGRMTATDTITVYAEVLDVPGNL